MFCHCWQWQNSRSTALLFSPLHDYRLSIWVFRNYIFYEIGYKLSRELAFFISVQFEGLWLAEEHLQQQSHGKKAVPCHIFQSSLVYTSPNRYTLQKMCHKGVTWCDVFFSRREKLWRDVTVLHCDVASRLCFKTQQNVTSCDAFFKIRRIYVFWNVFCNV